MRSKPIKGLALACVTLAAAGCASVPLAPGGFEPDVAGIDRWTAAGRIALVAAGEGGSGSFEWRQHGPETELTVRGPLGAGAMKVVTDGSAFTLEDGSGRDLDPQVARERLATQLGVNLPLGELRYWMLGAPAPGSMASVTLGSTERERVIEQAGWRVACSAFEPVGRWQLPARLTATSGSVRIKVVVDEWRVDPTPAPPEARVP